MGCSVTFPRSGIGGAAVMICGEIDSEDVSLGQLFVMNLWLASVCSAEDFRVDFVDVYGPGEGGSRRCLWASSWCLWAVSREWPPCLES